MLSEVCAYLRNYFDRDQPRYIGRIEIKNGALVSTYGLKPNQYFHIINSTFNDGVYKYPLTGLRDEIFDGAVCGMAVPPDLLALVDEMRRWKVKNEYALNTPYQSETKSDYSYSKPTNTDGSAMTVINHFSRRLARWRKI